jgi:hypothetical protein
MEPNNNDILLGRGGNNNKHVGNIQLRSLAHTHRTAYAEASKKSKSAIARELVNYIRGLTPPGRFLRKNTAADNWDLADEVVSKEKVSQALRDAVAGKDSGFCDILVTSSAAGEKVGPSPKMSTSPTLSARASAAPAPSPAPVPVSSSSTFYPETAPVSNLPSMDATELQLCMQMAATASNNFQANNFQGNNLQANSLQANNLSLLNALANGRGSGMNDQSAHGMLPDPVTADLLLSQRNAAMNGNYMTLGEISAAHPSQLEMSLMRSQIGMSNNQSFLHNTNQMDSMPRSVSDSDNSAHNRYKYYGRSAVQQMDTASIVERVMNRTQGLPGSYQQLGRLNENFQPDIPMNSFVSTADEAAQLREMFMAEQRQQKNIHHEMLRSPPSSMGSLHDAQSVQVHLQERIKIRSRRGPQQRVHHLHFNDRSSAAGIETISNFSSNIASEVDLANFDWMRNTDHQGSDMMCD